MTMEDEEGFEGIEDEILQSGGKSVYVIVSMRMTSVTGLGVRERSLEDINEKFAEFRNKFERKDC